MVSTILMAVLLLDSFVLAMAVLLQAGQGGGLASLGGGSGTEMFMGGRQATTLLTKITWSCAGLFLFLSLCLAILSARGAALRARGQRPGTGARAGGTTAAPDAAAADSTKTAESQSLSLSSARP